MIETTNYFSIIERENAKKIHSDQSRSGESSGSGGGGGGGGDLHSRRVKTARDRKK